MLPAKGHRTKSPLPGEDFSAEMLVCLTRTGAFHFADKITDVDMRFNPDDEMNMSFCAADLIKENSFGLLALISDEIVGERFDIWRERWRIAVCVPVEMQEDFAEDMRLHG